MKETHSPTALCKWSLLGQEENVIFHFGCVFLSLTFSVLVITALAVKRAHSVHLFACVCVKRTGAMEARENHQDYMLLSSTSDFPLFLCLCLCLLYFYGWPASPHARWIFLDVRGWWASPGLKNLKLLINSSWVQERAKKKRRKKKKNEIMCVCSSRLSDTNILKRLSLI